MRISKYMFCLLFGLLSLIVDADAQVRVVNEDGDVLILMPDGKWKYEDEAKEQMRTDKDAPIPKNVVPTTVQKRKVASDTTKVKIIPAKTEPSAPVVTQPRKGTVYPVPKRKRKVDTPVIPEVECEYSVRERDEFTNKIKVMTKPQPFFAYTQKELQPFMREDDYLKCSGSLGRVMGMTILNLKFEIESTMAQQEYGRIVAGSQLMVKLLDGTTVKLTCQESEEGTVDENGGRTVYRTFYGIDKNEEKQLLKSEVIKVRMVWSKGFEDYEVNELDFFIDHLNCLDAVND